MPDNKLIKDALGQSFTIRMRDISAGGDGSIQRSMIFTTGYPIDYGTGGSYRDAARSGSMGAPPIYSRPSRTRAQRSSSCPTGREIGDYPILA